VEKEDVMIRRSNAADCGDIYEMICDMEKETLDRNVFDLIYLEQLNNENMLCLVSEDGGGVRAFINLRFEMQLHHCERICEIMEFVVKDGYRDRGLGAAVLEAAFRAARENGCAQIEVACNQLREDAHRFYIREGMNNFHYKFSKRLSGRDSGENRLGR
jgi:PhnO protein